MLDVRVAGSVLAVATAVFGVCALGAATPAHAEAPTAGSKTTSGTGAKASHAGKTAVTPQNVPLDSMSGDENNPTIVNNPFTITGNVGAVDLPRTYADTTVELSGAYGTGRAPLSKWVYCTNTAFTDPADGVVDVIGDFGGLYGKAPVDPVTGDFTCDVGVDPNAATDGFKLFNPMVDTDEPLEVGGRQYFKDWQSGDYLDGGWVRVADTPVVFGDPNVWDAVDHALGKSVGEPVGRQEILALTSLDLHGVGTTDLSGLEWAKNLTSLNLALNKGLSDLSPIAGLTKLTTLYAYDTAVSDLSPLSGLTGLTSLYAYDDAISDLSPLSGLTSLTTLNLYNNKITDLSPLAGLVNLTDLRVHHNQITDLSPLSGMTHLTYLVVAENQVTSLAPLSHLTGLTNLYAYSNQVTDVTPIAGLTNLKLLALADNQITDVAPLKNMTQLVNLSLRNNHVGDLSALHTLTNLDPAQTFLSGQTNAPAGTLLIPEGATTFTTPLTGLKNRDGSAPAPAAGTGYTVTGDTVTFTGLPTTKSNGKAKASVSVPPVGFTGTESFAGTAVFQSAPAVFTNTNPAAGTVGAHYRFVFTTTTGFAHQYTTSTSIPGLTLGADGALTGTPTKAGDYTITVTATDANNNPLTKTFPVHVGTVVPTPPGPNNGGGTNNNGTTTTTTSGPLAHTGSTMPSWPLPLALSLLLAGIGTLTARLLVSRKRANHTIPTSTATTTE